jgi:hypothetical protein
VVRVARRGDEDVDRVGAPLQFGPVEAACATGASRGADLPMRTAAWTSNPAGTRARRR